jgi:hypothetical protein
MLNKENITKPVENLEKTIRSLNDNIGNRNKSAFRKYPVIFSLLVTFALVSILYGFELIFAKIQFIQDNPWALILIGLIILVGTGSTYKVLDKN